jgi:PQQ-dependent catabolism-associated CXXCW motif protein
MVHPLARLLLVCALVGGAWAGLAADAEDDKLFDPVTGFRMSHYRAAVPPDVPGGRRVDIDDLDALLAVEKPVLLDVMPSEGPGADLITGAWRLAKTHQHIPGSTWLPDVGRGRLTPEFECYFKSNLARLSGGDTSRPIVVYCQSDCWMSWNAVKRAAGYGYSRLYWFADGVDGWRDWDRPFAAAQPVPLELAKRPKVCDPNERKF